MNKNHLLGVLSFADDKYIEEADPAHKNYEPIFNWKMLTAIAACACVVVIGILLGVFLPLKSNSPTNNNPILETPGIGETPELVRESLNLCVKKSDGTDKCFWDDGKIYFDDFCHDGRQEEKSAHLTVGEEYDMFFVHFVEDLGFSLDPAFILDFSAIYYEPEYEYDKTKIEIKVNPEKKNHFLLKVLKPCDKENLTVYIKKRNPLDDILDENGNPVSVQSPDKLSIVISAAE